MAIYTPRAERRRRLLLLVAAAFVLGAVLGVLGGRLTAPTARDQVAEVRTHAEQITAQLRVLSIHAQSGAASLGANGDAGAALALRRADEQLTSTFDEAPWITPGTQHGLHQRLRGLERDTSAAASQSFGAGADHLATDIDHTFGIGG